MFAKLDSCAKLNPSLCPLRPTLQRWYDDAIKAAGIEKKGGPHTARHTFATILRANGFTLDEIQLILGHSSRVTTEIYAKLTMTPEVRDKYLALYEGGAYKNSFRAAGESQHR